MSSSSAKKILDEFFKNLRGFGDRLSQEDVDVAVESLQIAFDDLKLMKREALQKKKEAEQEKREEEQKRKKEEKNRKQKEHIDSFVTIKYWVYIVIYWPVTNGKRDKNTALN